MLLDSPASTVIPKIGYNELWCSEGAVSVAEGRPNTGVAEADDVRSAIGTEISEQAWIA